MTHIKTFKSYSLLLVLFVVVNGCKTKQTVQHLSDADISYIRLNEVKENNEEIEELIAPYREKLAQEMNVVIGSVDQDLYKSRPNSNLGNWFSDLLEDSAKEIFGESNVDFAIQNYGGIRLSSLPAGDITKGKIFELMPFDNTLVNVEMNPETLQMFLNRIADYGGWPISKSLSFTIQDSTAVDVLINNKPIEDRNYYVAMPDYVANGGDQCYFLSDSRKEDSEKFIRKIVIDYLIKLQDQNISANVDSSERIKVKENE